MYQSSSANVIQFPFRQTPLRQARAEKEEKYISIFSVRGLVAGFVYKVDFEWVVLEKENTHHWYKYFSSSTSSYTVRQPLSQTSQQARAWLDAYISKQDPYEIEVTVLDMHPGLTNEHDLIGARRMNSAVNTARLKCESWRKNVLDADWWKVTLGIDDASLEQFPGMHLTSRSYCARCTRADSQHSRSNRKGYSHAHPWSSPRKYCLCRVDDLRVSCRLFAVRSRRKTRSITHTACARRNRIVAK